MKSPLFAAALLSSLAVPQALAGSTSTNEFDIEVSIDRAALDDSKLIADEYDKIEDQVSNRCEAEHSNFTALRKFIAIRKCVNETMDRTVQQIDHAGLTKLHKAERLG